jgi:hypothetical protein
VTSHRKFAIPHRHGHPGQKRKSTSPAACAPASNHARAGGRVLSG